MQNINTSYGAGALGNVVRKGIDKLPVTTNQPEGKETNTKQATPQGVMIHDTRAWDSLSGKMPEWLKESIKPADHIAGAGALPDKKIRV